MIYSLRKRHRLSWSLLAFLLPAGFILAVLSIPEKKFDTKNLGFGQVEALMDVEKSAMGAKLKANLRKAPNRTKRQVEIMVMHPLQSPAATVYVGPEIFNQPNKGQLLGQLGPKGVYRFNLDSIQSQYKEIHLFIYDPIKQQPIDQISF